MCSCVCICVGFPTLSNWASYNFNSVRHYLPWEQYWIPQVKAQSHKTAPQLQTPITKSQTWLNNMQSQGWFPWQPTLSSGALPSHHININTGCGWKGFINNIFISPYHLRNPKILEALCQEWDEDQIYISCYKSQIHLLLFERQSWLPSIFQRPPPPPVLLVHGQVFSCHYTLSTNSVYLVTKCCLLFL